MRDVEYYALNVLRESLNAITIVCNEKRLPLNSELLKYKKHIFKVVYILKNKNNYEIRMENVKWR